MPSEKRGQLHSEITVQLVFENDDIAQAIAKSTEPENQETPKGVTAQSKLDGSNLQITISSENSLNYLLSTLEDYFEKIDLSYKTITNLKEWMLN